MSHLTEDDLTLLLYGELPDIEAAAARGHLDTCASCRAERDALVRTLALVDRYPVPEPAEEYEVEVWRRLQPAIRAATPQTVGLVARLRGWVVPHRGWTLAGAMAAVIVVAFVTGRYWQANRPATPPVTAAQSPTGNDIRERILLTALGDHFDRTQAMLVELTSADAAQTVDISGEQRRAHDLLAATRIYRRAASEAGDRAVGDVLEALERVLVEVTVSPSQLTAYELASLQRRIAEQELLFKVRVAAASVYERQQSTRRPPVRGSAGA